MFVSVFAKTFPDLASQSCFEVSRPKAVGEYEYRLFSQLLQRWVYQQSIKKTASGLKLNFKSILLPELLRILFWACIGALAVSLLALIIAGLYFHQK